MVEPADGPGCIAWVLWRFRSGVCLQRWLDAQNVGLAIGVTSLPAIKLLLATRLIGVPCVVSERNFPPSKRIGRIWSELRRLSYPWASLHLVQTQAVGEWMKTHLRLIGSCCFPIPCSGL